MTAAINKSPGIRCCAIQSIQVYVEDAQSRPFVDSGWLYIAVVAWNELRRIVFADAYMISCANVPFSLNELDLIISKRSMTRLGMDMPRLKCFFHQIPRCAEAASCGPRESQMSGRERRRSLTVGFAFLSITMLL